MAGYPGAVIDPMLGPLQNNGCPTLTHSLLAGSPAIDAGTCSSLTRDKRGVARIYNGVCNFGACEVAPSVNANIGPLTIFLSSVSPSDNGKIIDIKADILIGDSIHSYHIILKKRIAGMQNQNGIRIDIPVIVTTVPANNSDNIRVLVSIRNADIHGMSIRQLIAVRHIRILGPAKTTFNGILLNRYGTAFMPKGLLWRKTEG